MLNVIETVETPKKTNGSNPKPTSKRHTSHNHTPKGMPVNRVFTQSGADPFDGIEWDLRKASITDDKGTVIFVQEDIEVPKNWSMLATNIVASKYFYGGLLGRVLFLSTIYCIPKKMKI